MHTRETHARIYQGEIEENQYRELKSGAEEEGVSLSKFILERINDYLKKWDPKYPLQLEEMALDDGRSRFYLWVAYEKYAELDHLMKAGGSCIQELTRKAIRQQIE